MSDELKHYGTPRHSGRYPWGSGEDPYQGESFYKYVKDLKDTGMSEKDIAYSLGMTTTEYRNKYRVSVAQRQAENVARAQYLFDRGYSKSEVARKMGTNESNVRNWLKESTQEKAVMAQNTADVLKLSIKEKQFIDIGAGVEQHLGISRAKLKTAVQMLEDEGYKKFYVKVPQLGTGKFTSVMVLAPPGTEYSEVYKNRESISLPTDWHSNDGGRSFLGLLPIENVPQNKILVRYGEEGGADKDGIIELRRGVDNLDLGNSRYAQVRIGVEGDMFLKGMAMYTDDIPDGYDLIFNTNKKVGTPIESVYKKQTGDPDNPFKSTIKVGGQRGALNIVNEEGDWGEWSKTLSSQMLAKQHPSLIKRQLDLAYNIKQGEYNDIMALTNPTIKKHLLQKFSDDCDSSAVHLKAAALPRQATHVILPFPKMKENEVYATNFRNGEEVVLIRYPHGGIFEIPTLKVNNKYREAIDIIGRPKDAIGINPKVAERLSGADFDGDTVLVIPTRGIDIRTEPRLKDLKNFDPKVNYPSYKGMQRMTKSQTQDEMGKISNLITDMTVKGANFSEITRAVKHSMVVIDAEKHELNYKQSYIDNDIASLKVKYQGGANKGASTLLSKASSEQRVTKRSDTYKIDPDTGKKIFTEVGGTYVNKKGKETKLTTKTTKMYEVDDAYELSSGTRQENLYADYANKLKSLANKSRKEAVSTIDIQYSSSARTTYKDEVASLTSKLNTALKNAPVERQAQIIANAVVAAKVKDNPQIKDDGDSYKKLKNQALTEARLRTNAKKASIDITDREWEAIQSGAVSKTTLNKILTNTDLDRIKELATPRTNKVTLSSSNIAKAKSMSNYGYTQAEIADALGVSVSTISSIISGEKE